MKSVIVLSRLLFLFVGLAGIAVPHIDAQAIPTPTTAEIDAKLTKCFELYSRGLLTLAIDEEIARATKASAGQKPKEIVISNSRVQVSMQHVPSSQLPRGIPFLLLAGVANADLIVMGVPISARSLPLKDRTFLFTQYTVRVSRIFSDDPRGLFVWDTIIVSMGGGSLVVDGVLVRANDPAFDQFRLDEPLVLMLKAIPGTGTYQAVPAWTFMIREGLVSVVSKVEPGRGVRERPLSEFLSDLEAAVTYGRLRRR
jgi:hypothetical protein